MRWIQGFIGRGKYIILGLINPGIH
jgi:hypothetical protein